MNNFQLQALNLLQTHDSKTDNLRTTELLKQPTGQTEAWAFTLGRAFNEPLNILYSSTQATKNIWTQSNAFKFAKGDRIYSKSIENQTWQETLEKDTTLLVITEALPVIKSPIEKKHAGSVTCEIHKPNSDRNAMELITTITYSSQLDFVKFLITGDCRE